MNDNSFSSQRPSPSLLPFSPSFDVQPQHRTNRHRHSSMSRLTSTPNELSPDLLIRRLREYSVPSEGKSSSLASHYPSLTLPPLSPSSQNPPFCEGHHAVNHQNTSTSTEETHSKAKQAMTFLLNGSSTSSDMINPPISLVYPPPSTPKGTKEPSAPHGHTCRKCHATFSSRMHLNRHVKSDHQNDRPFQCDICGSRFNKKDHAIKHWRVVHLRERPFECPHCESRFGQRSDLNKHHRSVHLGIRPFECTQCGQRFSHKGNLIRHQTVIHQKTRAFSCSMCPATFAEKSNLVKHQQAKHKGSLSAIHFHQSNGLTNRKL